MVLWKCLLGTSSDVEVINVEMARLIKYKALAGWKGKRLGKLRTSVCGGNICAPEGDEDLKKR